MPASQAQRQGPLTDLSAALCQPLYVPVAEVRPGAQGVAAAEVVRPHLAATLAGDHQTVEGAAADLGDDERAGEPARREVLLPWGMLRADGPLVRGLKPGGVRERDGQQVGPVLTQVALPVDPPFAAELVQAVGRPGTSAANRSDERAVGGREFETVLLFERT